MAFYLIGYRCGHDVREQIYGTDVHGEREAEAARRAAQLCPPCRRADRDATAAAAAQALGLPELTGSEGQVRWATTIRHDAFGALERQMSKPTAALADIQARTVAYRAVLASVTSARAWIDHRAAVRSPVPDLIAEFLDDTGRARLSDIAAKELAPVLAAADADPGAPTKSEPADATAAARIQPVEPGAGPVLELPMLVSRAHRVWRAVRAGLAEPWRIPTLHPTLIPALTETSLTGYLLRTAVNDAATEPSQVTSVEVYRSARLLLDIYRNHTHHNHMPDLDGTCGNSTIEAAPAPADWWVKARVRVTTAARCGHRVFTPGQELDLLAFGFAGHPRREDSWWDTDPATALDIHNELDDVAVIESDNVEVISILGRSAS